MIHTHTSIKQLYKYLAHKTLLTDSRKLTKPNDAIFFAITGVRYDGHDFMYELCERGVTYFIVDCLKKVHTVETAYKQVHFFLVENTLETLQKLAAFHRKQFDIPVIGITGSNGKTIVKEWLSQCFEQKYVLVKSPQSYNSQLGVPLSVLQIEPQHELGLFEAGISQVGEMALLESMIQPTVGILSNIGSAHDENFTSQKEKLIQKLLLFANSKVLIYCADYSLITAVFEDNHYDIPQFTWAFEADADIKIEKVTQHTHTQLSFDYQNTHYVFDIPFVEKASIENCTHCLVTLLYFGMDTAHIQHSINSLSNVEMRLEMKDGINRCLLIDDTYNNDLVGLEAALDFIAQSHQRRQKTLILSDMHQTGITNHVLYPKILNWCQDKGIGRVIGIGKEIQNFVAVGFQTTQDFLTSFYAKKLEFDNELLLIKGARVFEFERIVDALEEKIHGTCLEINLDALVNNLNVYKSKINEQTKLMVMVKAYAYGSRHIEVANVLQYHRVDYLAVAYPDEGITLRQNGVHLPIMVMNPSPDSFSKLIQHQLEPEIYSMSILSKLVSIPTHMPIAIHLKLDTGMHRLGFLESELKSLLDVLKAHQENVRVASIFTHLAAADEAQHDAFSLAQLQEFGRMSQQLTSALGYRPLLHALNSVGMLRLPDYQLDMVRLGIGLYGVDSAKVCQDDLENVGTLKTTISQIKHIPQGASIGYSRKGRAKSRPMKIATLAIGYADGYDRRFGNGVGSVLINDQIAYVVGNVCMDMCMVDVTGLDVQEGDQAIVFGQTPSVIELAKRIDTIPYDLLTNVGQRVKRVFVKH